MIGGLVLAVVAAQAMVPATAAENPSDTMGWIQLGLTLVGLAITVGGGLWYLSSRLQRNETAQAGEFKLVALQLSNMGKTVTAMGQTVVQGFAESRDARSKLWEKLNAETRKAERLATVCAMTHDRDPMALGGGNARGED